MSHEQDTPAQASDHPPAPKEVRSEIRTSMWIILLNFLFLIAVVAVAFQWADWSSFLYAVIHIDLLWIAVVVVLQAGTYVCVAYAWHSVLRRFKTPIPIRSLLSLSLIKLFLDQAFPVFGLGGTAVAMRGFLRRGSAANVAVAAAAVYVLVESALNILFLFLALFILGANHDINPFFSVTNVLLICIAGVAVLLVLLYAIRDTRLLRAFKNLQPIAWLIKTARDIPRHTLADFGLWASVSIALAAIWIFDALTLWALLMALGVHAPLSTAFACSIISSVVANIVIVPGGLGIFEGSSIAIMSLFGIPLEQAIAAALLMRGFTYWLPMVPGFLITRGEFI